MSESSFFQSSVDESLSEISISLSLPSTALSSDIAASFLIVTFGCTSSLTLNIILGKIGCSPFPSPFSYSNKNIESDLLYYNFNFVI